MRYFFKLKSCYLFLFSIISFTFFGCTIKGKFVKLDASQTNIHFANTITENDSINVFNFANIYNGGGVGVGDFNNDGLMDLYFTGNMVSNRLYLNKGKMKFEDVTTESNTNGNGEWCRGVAVVDINNDGLPDLYVCATAKRNPLERKNILYVNQGLDKNKVPVFKNMAHEYGLDDTSQSTMAYFFDYDNDGDLDLFIGVNHIINGENANTFRTRNLNGEHPSTCRLYRNDWSDSLKHPVFTNVSKQAGILIEGYTHAADVFDINDDGWMDILVTNDYTSDNVLYINNHNGTFTDETMQYFKHTAANSMGSDAIDINNDGLDDVVEVDMSPEDNFRKKMFQNANNYNMYQNTELYHYQYQYPRNMLQLNQGSTVNENDSIGHPVFSDVGYFSGVAQTDWSWTPLVADFDNDGKRDILFTNGFPKDITDHDFAAYRRTAGGLITKAEMLSEIPSVKIHNYIFKNNGNLNFSDETENWGLQEPGFSNGAAYVDLDNDGDLDVVINNIDDSAMIYENRINTAAAKQKFIDLKFKGSAKNINGIGAKVTVYQKDSVQTFLNNPYRGYISSVTPIMHFGLNNNQVDSIVIFWPGNLKQVIKNPKLDELLTVNIKDAILFFRQPNTLINNSGLFTNETHAAGINYVHQQRDFIDFSMQNLLPHKLTEYVPGIAVGDINGDWLDDFITGASPGFNAMEFLQNAQGKFLSKPLLKSETDSSKVSDDRGVLLFDADGDGDPDLYISAGGYAYEPGDTGYTDHFYVNDGKGNFTLDNNAIPVNTTSKFCVRACDYDKDGDLDLFIAGRVKPWNYPQPVSSFIYRNDSKNGKIKFTDVTASVAPALKNIGLSCDAIWTDFDNDGWPDLILAGEWMPVKFLKNEHGVFKDISASSGINNKLGWWNSIVTGDFDNDGDIDYVVGNLGLNSFYKASDKYPINNYAKDFNNNGTMQCICTKYIKDKQGGKLQEVTVNTRDDIISQLPFLKKNFLTYNAFANATFSQLFTEDNLKGALKSTANYFSSSFIRNNGNNNFSIEPLPNVAQFSVINGMLADDFDGDGNLDICINTNDYSTEPGNGRYDALNGLVLKGDGKGGFTPLSILQSGICITGNGKGLVKLRGANNNYLIAATQNRGALQVYKAKQATKIITVMPDDAYAILTLNNGRKQKTEFYYGASFLSQSGRFLSIGNTIKSCVIVNNKGTQRSVAIK